MLMGIGSLATIGVKAPKNLAIVVLDNARYGETGMQPSHTQAGVDLVAVARACRFRDARAMSASRRRPKSAASLHAGEGPIFVSAKIKPEDTRAFCRCATATPSNSSSSAALKST